MTSLPSWNRVSEGTAGTTVGGAILPQQHKCSWFPVSCTCYSQWGNTPLIAGQQGTFLNRRVHIDCQMYFVKNCVNIQWVRGERSAGETGV